MYMYLLYFFFVTVMNYFLFCNGKNYLPYLQALIPKCMSKIKKKVPTRFKMNGENSILIFIMYKCLVDQCNV